MTSPEPSQQQPFLLGQLAPQPPHPRTNWKLLAAIAAALLAVSVIGIVAAVTNSGTSTSSRRFTITPAAQTPGPVYGNPAEGRGWTPGPEYSPMPMPMPIPAANPTPTAAAGSETCTDSATWDQEGGTELLDGYINNQDSGNINPEELKAECPQYLPIWEKAKGGIGNGEAHPVPSEVRPGTYETTSSDLEDCYWERSRNGQIQANNFITATKVKQRVTIRPGDDTFVTRNCGNWIKVG